MLLVTAHVNTRIFLVLVSQVRELSEQVEQEAHRRTKLQAEIKQLEAAEQTWRTKERQLQQSVRDLTREKSSLEAAVTQK